MTTENVVGIQTRAMTEAQCTEGEVQRAMDNNQEGVQGANPTTGQAALDPTMNPTVELCKNDNIVIEEYVKRQGGIGLDWYVPIPRINTTVHTSFNGASPAPSANMTEAITQILAQVTNNNKQDDVSKQMMKNIKIFNSTNKAECITWLSQIEAAARFSNKPFRELICQSMAPLMLRVLSELSAVASDEDIKNAILTNYSDIPSTTEATTRLQNMQTSPTEPLVTFNHRYEAIHRVAFGLSPSEQYNKTIIVEYAKKLPQNTRDKLLRKIAKKNSYIRTLDDAFKQAIEINRETSFVEAASGRYNNQTYMKIETQVND